MNIENLDILHPRNQLKLFGYNDYFDSFDKLFIKNKMPNSILITGMKGIGKSTFVYHVVNYLLSLDENYKYLKEDFLINDQNSSYKKINDFTHPNVFLIENKLSEKDIKIESIRKLHEFLIKSTYSKDLKIVIIDDAEDLNLNSSNALLKSLEEPPKNTFFFIIHNSACRIHNTVKSRCVEFKVFFTENEKKNIFKNLTQQYNVNFDFSTLLENFYYDTPGNSLKYLFSLLKSDVNIDNNYLKILFYFIDKYNRDKNSENLSFILLFVEKFYKSLFLIKNKNLNKSFLNYSKILNQIDNMKKFNLDKNNTLVWLKNTLQNEKK